MEEHLACLIFTATIGVQIPMEEMECIMITLHYNWQVSEKHMPLAQITVINICSNVITA